MLSPVVRSMGLRTAREAKYEDSYGAVCEWRREVLQTISDIGDRWERDDDGPSCDVLKREVDWALDDAVAAVSRSDPPSQDQLGPDHPEWVRTPWRSIELDARSSERLGQAPSGWKLLLRVPTSELRLMWEQRLQERVPFQYLIASAHWLSFVLSVSPGVLIPRPETEIFVDFVTQALKQRPQLACCAWADLGTGSGAIAIAAASVLKTLKKPICEGSVEMLVPGGFIALETADREQAFLVADLLRGLCSVSSSSIRDDMDVAASCQEGSETMDVATSRQQGSATTSGKSSETIDIATSHQQGSDISSGQGSDTTSGQGSETASGRAAFEELAPSPDDAIMLPSADKGNNDVLVNPCDQDVSDLASIQRQLAELTASVNRISNNINIKVGMMKAEVASSKKEISQWKAEVVSHKTEMAQWKAEHVSYTTEIALWKADVVSNETEIELIGASCLLGACLLTKAINKPASKQAIHDANAIGLAPVAC
eukprot:gene25601-11253_t